MTDFGFVDVPYEDQTSTESFLAVMDKLMRPVFVHRFAMGRIRKDVDEGVPYPNRLARNREVAKKAQRECEDIMRGYIKHDVDCE